MEHQEITFLYQDEMNQLIDSEPDSITRHLMGLAVNTLFTRVVRNEPPPVSDFDLLYFMQVMQEFCGKHETIRKILDGKGDELGW